MPGRRRDLSADQVVAAAVEVLRDEGADALSMRRVADRCGVTPMAIYHHVDDKDALLGHAVDHVVAAALDVDPADGTWREAMTRFLAAIRAAMLDNRGAGAVWVQRPVVGPHMALVTERFFEILERGGVRGAAAAEATDALVLLMLGAIANDLTRPPEVRVQLRHHVPDAATPRLVDGIDAYASRDPDARFAVAVDWMLDGIERARS